MAWVVGSLRGKAAAGAVIVCGILFVGVIGQVYWGTSRQMEADLEDKVAASVAQAGDVLTKIGDRVQTYSALLASNPGLVASMTTGNDQTREQLFAGQF